MNETISMSVELPTDEGGMVGRECPSCSEYFKLKPGTGMDTERCSCPYCEHEDDSSEYLTAAQLEFVKSLALRKVAGPMLRELEETFKSLERNTRGSLLSFKVKTTGFDLPLKYYREEDLETGVTCDKCGLEFAVFGVFATCPDCRRLSTMSIFRVSLEVAGKRLSILDNVPPNETDLQDGILTDTLSSAVSAFDGLGKRLRAEFQSVFPARPRNLFQNLGALDPILKDQFGVGVAGLLESREANNLEYLFQVRHLWVHNFGEADEEFVRKTGASPNIIGSRIVPTREQVDQLLHSLDGLGLEIRNRLNGD